MEMRHRLMKKAQTDIAGWDAVVEKFKKDLDENPHHAMDWSESAFAAVAARHVGRMVLELAQHNGSMDAIERYVTQEALRTGRSPEHSTSQTANLLERYVAAHWARYAEMIHESKWYGENS